MITGEEVPVRNQEERPLGFLQGLQSPIDKLLAVVEDCGTPVLAAVARISNERSEVYPDKI